MEEEEEAQSDMIKGEKKRRKRRWDDKELEKEMKRGRRK